MNWGYFIMGNRMNWGYCYFIMGNWMNCTSGLIDHIDLCTFLSNKKYNLLIIGNVNAYGNWWVKWKEKQFYLNRK